VAINIQNAFDTEEDGFAVTDQDGNTELYVTSGTGDPSGSSAPINTWYLRQDSQLLYYKFGSGNSDWRQIRAGDITFDPSSNSLTATDLQAALAEASGLIDTNIADIATNASDISTNAGNIATNASNISSNDSDIADLQSQIDGLVYGLDFDETTRTSSLTVTGSSFTTYDTLNFNVSDVSGTNKYRVNCNFLYRHNAASNDIRVQLSIDGSTIEMREEPKDQGSDQRYTRSITAFVSNLSSGAHTALIQFRPATASRQSTLHRSIIEVWRVE